MAFGGFSQGGEPLPMSEINVTPLVDVMLVLLIIFMVTAPLLTHAVKLDLPQVPSPVNPEKPDTIAVSIDALGNVFWNGTPVAVPDLHARLRQEAVKVPQPELHLRADRDTRYQTVAEVMAAAQSSGMQKIGFVTDPAAARVAALHAKGR